jgi:hypothetical protein
MREAMEVRESIIVGKEAGAAIVAALHDVLRYSWKVETASTRHRLACWRDQPALQHAATRAEVVCVRQAM